MSTPAIDKVTLERIESLRSLWKIANGHSGQCRHVAAFLLGLYNGQRFRFDLTDFRCLDTAIFIDCLKVLALDHQPAMEVHQYLGVPTSAFEDLAVDWNIHDLANPERSQRRSTASRG